VKVVFHADDFGLTRGVNAGIVEAHERGLLASASLMVGAEAAEDAATLARSRPGLDVGLHVTLVEERPVLPPARIPSLVTDGRFWPNHTTIFARYVLGHWRVDEAAAEVAAQWERLAALGVSPSHWDGHQHLHLLPRLFPRIVPTAFRHGARFVRTQLVSAPPGGGSALRRALCAGVNVVAASAWRRTTRPERAGAMRFPTVGFLEAGGRLTRDRLLAILDHLRARGTEIVEVMLHPGHGDVETQRRYGHWNYHWDGDRELLLDAGLRDALASRGIEPTSFRDLAGHAGAA
jgi:predicted glycoside hydrolase/deacetylase ChbG (UPF0249 family)